MASAPDTSPTAARVQNIQYCSPLRELPSSVSKIVPKSLPTVDSTIYSKVEMAAQSENIAEIILGDSRNEEEQEDKKQPFALQKIIEPFHDILRNDSFRQRLSENSRQEESNV